MEYCRSVVPTRGYVLRALKPSFLLHQVTSMHAIYNRRDIQSNVYAYRSLSEIYNYSLSIKGNSDAINKGSHRRMIGQYIRGKWPLLKEGFRIFTCQLFLIKFCRLWLDVYVGLSVALICYLTLVTSLLDPTSAITRLPSVNCSFILLFLVNCLLLESD